MSDKQIMAAIIESAGSTAWVSEQAANALIKAGFRMGNPELDTRINGLAERLARIEGYLVVPS